MKIPNLEKESKTLFGAVKEKKSKWKNRSQLL
jgi:hypothetical protein